MRYAANLSPVRLSSGAWIDLRPLGPGDAAALTRLVEELSAESLYHRFFIALHQLSPAMLRYLTEVDGVDHVAVAAVVPDGDGDGGERLVGVGRFVREAGDPRAAEAAITVADDLQRQGLGRRLLGALIEEARHDDIDRLLFELKRSNTGMRRLLRSAGARVVAERGAEMTFELRVPAPVWQLAPLRLLTAQVQRLRRRLVA